MEFTFSDLHFSVSDHGKLLLDRCFGYDNRGKAAIEKCAFSEFDLPGGTSSGRVTMCGSAQAAALRYRSHSLEGDTLTTVQDNGIIRVTSRFQRYEDTNAIRVTQELTNISDTPQLLEMVNTIGLYFGEKDGWDPKDWYFHKFTNHRYSEGMPDVRSFHDCGLYYINGFYNVVNVGNHSSRLAIPQGIIEYRPSSDFLMFQIETYAGWYYELGVKGGLYQMQLGGPNQRYHDWQRQLAPGESCTTVPVTLCHGKSLNAVTGEMTRYRRHIKPRCPADAHLPAIFNEYMHLSWDDPYAHRTRTIAPAVAKSGCEYYIIDCGWQEKPDYSETDIIYRHFGTWKEDLTRFPGGIKATSDYIHSLGMKFGLWIAPEVVGVDNEEMLAYYDDSCFFCRNGKKITHGTGYLLDFRHPKVYDYMSRTIDRMVNDYGCDYIKFDGCPNAGFGTEVNSVSMGDGLARSMDAFLAWTKDMMDRYPNVLFEDCAGGGQRIDYRALSMFHLLSTSDQTRYNHYPYIVGNILCSVLPEQAGVWSYPVDQWVYDPENEKASDSLVSTERVALNMVNSLLGRVHLASRIQLLSEEKQALIQEGIDVYNAMTAHKLSAVPYLPKGYTQFGDTFVAAGLRTDEKVYLALWNLHGERDVTLPLPEISAKDIRVAYPASLPTDYSFTQDSLTVRFTQDEQARLFEITL